MKTENKVSLILFIGVTLMFALQFLLHPKAKAEPIYLSKVDSIQVVPEEMKTIVIVYSRHTTNTN